MPLDEKIFRKSALERLKNPERLDQLMQVTTPRDWLLTAATGLVVGAALLWGFLGDVPEQVPVVGIMLREGGVSEVQASGSGQVDTLLVGPGDKVEEGQVVALVDQPLLELDVTRLTREIARLSVHRDSLAQRLDETTRRELDALALQRTQTETDMATATARIAFLTERERADSIALDRGLIIGDVYQNTVSQLAIARHDSVAAEVRVEQLAGQAVTTRSTAADQVFQQDEAIASDAAQLVAARERLRTGREVTARLAGEILEVLVDQGESVIAGEAVYGIVQADRPLDVYLFTPEGQRVTAGMRVELIPTGMLPEEVGYLLGSVQKVGNSPLGQQSLNRFLRNDVLVQSFMGGTGVYLVEAQPEFDPESTSGFKWSSGRGPDVAFGSGTLLSGNVLVEIHRPITLVIPALKRWLAGDDS
jgi:HlyD family secretion protein